MSPIIRRASYDRPGRLIPRRARGLRARSVRLRPGACMPWHTTGTREELLIVLQGRLQLDAECCGRTPRRVALSQGQCVFLPRQTRHTLLNASSRVAAYVYVTGAA